MPRGITRWTTPSFRSSRGTIRLSALWPTSINSLLATRTAKRSAAHVRASGRPPRTSGRFGRIQNGRGGGNSDGQGGRRGGGRSGGLNNGRGGGRGGGRSGASCAGGDRSGPGRCAANKENHTPALAGEGAPPAAGAGSPGRCWRGLDRPLTGGPGGPGLPLTPWQLSGYADRGTRRPPVDAGGPGASRFVGFRVAQSHLK